MSAQTIRLTCRPEWRAHALDAVNVFASWGERAPGHAGSGVVTYRNGAAFVVWRTKGGTIVVRENVKVRS